jgi:hypothetical protein
MREQGETMLMQVREQVYLACCHRCCPCCLVLLCTVVVPSAVENGEEERLGPVHDVLHDQLAVADFLLTVSLALCRVGGAAAQHGTAQHGATSL